MALEDEIEGYLDELEGGDANVRFGRLLTICENVFGEPRTKGSHYIFKTPWPGKPWVNLQEDDGEAKSYQVQDHGHYKDGTDKEGTMGANTPDEWALEKASRYTYQVQWSHEDEVFVGRVLEWDLLAAHGDTEQAALEEIREVVAFAIEESEADGEEPPEPLGDKEFSGRFNVRIPSSLHRELATEAEREGVSLNQLVTTKLAR